MKSSPSIFLLVFFLSAFMFGQGETNNWYFGFGAGIGFNNDGSITTFLDSGMDSFEGCATISDASGNLLCYSNGNTVYNRNHQVMQNGAGLYGNQSSTQSALFVPQPENPNILFLFTVDATTNNIRGRGLNYSVIDLSLDNGLGGVIQKNVNLLNDCAEKLAAIIKDCTANSVWVVTQATETGASVITPPYPDFNTLHAFEVNITGVVPASIKSTFVGAQILDDRGYIKFSPDGSKFVSANMGAGLYLYDFDKATGTFSNKSGIVINNPNTAPYGVEFSPNSRYLYVHATNNRYAYTGHLSTLLQYDVLAVDISATQVILDERALIRGALQLGVNGKIYRTIAEGYPDGESFLGMINNPNEAGLAANYQHIGLALGNKTNGHGLPSFVQSLFREVNLVPETVNLVNNTYAVCLGDPIILETQQIPGATYTWEKDNVPFTNPDNHSFQIASADVLDAGNYRVTIIRPNASECPIIGETSVFVDQIPEANDRTILQCDMEDANSTDGISLVDLTQTESNANLTYLYYETMADRDNDTPITDPENFRNTQPFDQLLYYKISNSSGCENFGEVQLYIQPTPSFTFEDTYLLCTDNPALALRGPDGFDAYRWLKLEGTTEFSIAATQAVDIFEIGNYRLETSSTVSQDGETRSCTSTTDFEVLPSNPAEIDAINVNDITDNNTIEVEVSGDGDYEFSVDGNIFQDTNFFEYVPSGIVTVYVRDKNGCGLVEETIELDPELTSGGFPKFFTPNGDNINDFWQFIPSGDTGDIDVKSIYIYNRLGQLMALLDPSSQGWDGTFNGRPMAASDYWFRAVSFNNQIIQGHFTLKR